ncbi:MAG: hypothetical protein R3C59_14680 [Planctomycetaceae bacterium]
MITNVDNDNVGVTVSAISGDTTESGGTATFTVVLNSEPTADVSIGLSSSDTTEGTVTATPLTFTPLNWNQARAVTVSGQNDDVDDGDITYNIQVLPAVSSDPLYHGFDANDIVGNERRQRQRGRDGVGHQRRATESGGTATFTVVLNSEPTADVSIGLSSSDTTEGTVTTTPLTFTPLNWNQAQTVTVSGQNDDVDDGDITYSIQVLPAVSSDPLYNGFDANDVSVTNVDNDSVGVTVSAISNDTTESGGTAFTVVLNSRTRPTFPSDCQVRRLKAR